MKKIYLMVRGEKKGPFTLEQIRQQLASGEASLFDVVESEGRRLTLQEILPPETSPPALEPAPKALGKPIPPTPASPSPPAPGWSSAPQPPGRQVAQDPWSGVPSRPSPPPARTPDWAPATFPPAGTTEPLATWSLVLGLLGLFCCGCIFGLGAVICGHLAISKIDKFPVLGGRGMAVAGLILGYLGLAFWVLWLLFGNLLPLLQQVAK